MDLAARVCICTRHTRAALIIRLSAWQSSWLFWCQLMDGLPSAACRMCSYNSSRLASEHLDGENFNQGSDKLAMREEERVTDYSQQRPSGA